MLLFKLFFLCAFIAMASARPDGAPLDACGSMDPTGHQVGELPTSQNLGYTVNTLRDNLMGRYLIYVIGEREFRGIFIQVRQGNTAVGSFSPPPENYKLINCFQRQGSAFTHSNRKLKGISVTAVWNPPNICVGELTAMVTVVSNFTTFETGLTTNFPCPTTSPPDVAPIQPGGNVLPPRVVAPLPPVFPPQRPPSGGPVIPPVRPSVLPPTGEVISAGKRTCRFPNVGVVPSSEYRTGFETLQLNGWVNTGSPRMLGRRRRTTGGQYFQFDNFGSSDVGLATSSEPTWNRVERYTTKRRNYFMRMGVMGLMAGDTVILHTGLNLRGCFCLHFNYRVLVPGDTLTVYSDQTPLATITQGKDVWMKMLLQVESQQTTRIRIVGTKSRLSRGMMDIDNLAITKGPCPSSNDARKV